LVDFLKNLLFNWNAVGTVLSIQAEFYHRLFCSFARHYFNLEFAKLSQNLCGFAWCCLFIGVYNFFDKLKTAFFSVRGRAGLFPLTKMEEEIPSSSNKKFQERKHSYPPSK
jgi:hypothetical protein